MLEQGCSGGESHEYTPWKKGSEWIAIMGKINVYGLSFDG
jgi:hypothetical protein